VDSAERPHQSEYRRYIYLVELFRSLDYDPQALYAQSPFKIYDIGINSILTRADRDLLALSERFGSADERSTLQTNLQRASEGFSKLWNAELKCYNGYDLRADRRLELPISAGFLPLFAGIPIADQATTMSRELARWGALTRYLVPSLAPDHSLFEPKRYWRGPVWSVVNYMIAVGLEDYGIDGLAKQIRADTLALTEVGEFHEYFDPEDGSGCGGGVFSWTAAIAIWWQ
jgi:glycogen debranching enzyme